MSFTDAMKDALASSPAGHTAPIREKQPRPQAQGYTGIRPFWNRKSYPVENTPAFAKDWKSLSVEEKEQAMLASGWEKNGSKWIYKG